jgi:hypothetical protein
MAVGSMHKLLMKNITYYLLSARARPLECTICKLLIWQGWSGWHLLVLLGTYCCGRESTHISCVDGQLRRRSMSTGSQKHLSAFWFEDRCAKVMEKGGRNDKWRARRVLAAVFTIPIGSDLTRCPGKNLSCRMQTCNASSSNSFAFPEFLLEASCH